MTLSDQVKHPGLWPTPTATDSSSGKNARVYARGNPTLSAAITMWPTPTATLGNKGGVVTPAKARANGNLIEALALDYWPTPTADDTGARVAPHAHDGTPPGLAVRYPTPMKTDAGCASPGRFRRVTPQLCCYADGGPLNPAWVEWLMGWPVGWTDLAPLDRAHFEAWTRQNGPHAPGAPDPWFGIDPATLAPHAPGFVPRMASGKVANRAKRIEALGNGQVPRCVVQAWRVLLDVPAANDETANDDAPRLAAGRQS
ncbi:hypothetical protein PUN4_320004 [Paraburkholderia unamae]|uniref:hypothetical protein n=1 Tax=Paraburkholderia unamae TaxID=219649 RepID=UPI001CACB7F9|nr:hypothetical protein [Paraburkholderia unamae]CAG9258484.1 hypothetical protein PUN4_320004 [Paraburkholderia unamae]